MAFVLRFVQRYRIDSQDAFWKLEREFAELERRTPGFPQGTRMRPVAGREPGHTLVWECEFPELADVHAALRALESSPDHAALFAQQSPLMLEGYTEIYERLDL